MPPAAHFLPTAAKSIQKTPPEIRVSGLPKRAPYVLGCWGAYHTFGSIMQGGMKCRIVSALAPLPLTVRNVGVFAPISGAMWASPPTPPEETFRLSVGADAHVGPSVIGIVLQIPRLPAGKEVAKPWFRARFWLLFPHGKSNPPEADPTNSTASPIFVHIAHQNPKILCKFIPNTYLHYLAKVILY